MKAVFFTLSLLLSLSAFAQSFSPLQKKAVKFMIEESHGLVANDIYEDYLQLSRVLTKKELKKFPEIMPHDGFKYVLVEIGDCVYDVAIVVIDPTGEPLSTLYIDFSERN